MFQSLNLNRLRCKEVISIADGGRIGFVEDIEIDTTSGRVASIVVPSSRFLSFLRPTKTIPWDKIRKIGNDTVLVDWTDAKVITDASDTERNL